MWGHRRRKFIGLQGDYAGIKNICKEYVSFSFLRAAKPQFRQPSYTRDRQNNMNTWYIHNIYLLIRCWATICLCDSCNSSRNRFAKYLNVMFFHPWSKASANCFKDVLNANLLLTLPAQTPCSCSIMLKSGSCAGQGRFLMIFWYSLNQAWNFLAVCINMLNIVRTPASAE